MKKYFYLDVRPGDEKSFILRCDPSMMYFPTGINTTYAIIEARLMGLDFPDYIRFCRDELGARISGKGNNYPLIIFSKTPKVEKFVKILNNRIDFVLHGKKNYDDKLEREFLDECKKENEEKCSGDL